FSTCFSLSVARSDPSTAEAKDPAGPAGLVLERGGTTACPADRGRLALGGSLHTRVSQSSPRPSSYGLYTHCADLSSRLYATVGPPLPHDAVYARPSRSQAGRGHGRAGRKRQGIASRGAPASGSQDRWGAAVCGRADQDGVGIGVVEGAR